RELAARQRGRAHDGCTHVGRVRALAEGAGIVEIGVRVLTESCGIRAVGCRALPDRCRIARADLCPLADRGAVAVIGQRALADGCRVRRIRMGGVPSAVAFVWPVPVPACAWPPIAVVPLL